MTDKDGYTPVLPSTPPNFVDTVNELNRRYEILLEFIKEIASQNIHVHPEQLMHNFINYNYRAQLLLNKLIESGKDKP